MALDLYAGIPVSDYPSALAWYERLLGSPPRFVAGATEAVWELAGPLRSADRLERLLDDPYPLARLVARFALERRESRGSHQRLEYPEQDPELDGRHILCRGDEMRWQAWE